MLPMKHAPQAFVCVELLDLVMVVQQPLLVMPPTINVYVVQLELQLQDVQFQKLVLWGPVCADQLHHVT